jgi:hypothetical protein
MMNGGVAGVGAGKDAKAWHAGMGIMCFFTIMWIVGISLLAVGLTSQSATSEYDPATDFAEVPGGCKVLSVTHVAEQRQDNNPYCVDVYTYTFSKTTEPGTVHTSGADEQQHPKGTRCENTTPLPALYAENDETDCWEPAEGKTVADVEDFYQCGNTLCLKLIDPADEHASQAATAQIFIMIGSILLGVGCPGCGITGYFTKKCKSAGK